MTIHDELIREANQALAEAKRANPDLDPALTCDELRTVNTPGGMHFEVVITPYLADPEQRRQVREALAERSLNIAIATRW